MIRFKETLEGKIADALCKDVDISVGFWSSEEYGSAKPRQEIITILKQFNLYEEK